jgi:hypothetical protein
MPHRARNRMMRLIADVDDPRFLGPILSLLAPDTVTGPSAELQWEKYSRPMVAACKSLLLRVRTDQEVLLDREQMRMLLALLESQSWNIQFQLAILKALEQIGDETAVPIVEKLASGRQHTRGMTMMERWLAGRPEPDAVMLAAQECLPFLHLRAQRRQAAQTLLRASANSEALAPEMLLRPATAVESAPEQLLRPHG